VASQTAPSSCSQGDLTALLATLGADRLAEQAAADGQLPAVYDELREMARSLLRSENPSHTLQATALVHETYLKLVGQDASRWRDRGHFFALAAQAMRRILVDHARGKNRIKRGGGERQLMLSDVCAISPQRDIDLLALDDALERLAKDDAMDARIVEMRFFAGLDVHEIAQILGVCEKTVQRHWNYARAWLYRALTSRETRAAEMNGQ